MWVWRATDTSLYRHQVTLFPEWCVESCCALVSLGMWPETATAELAWMGICLLLPLPNPFPPLSPSSYYSPPPLSLPLSVSPPPSVASTNTDIVSHCIGRECLCRSAVLRSPAPVLNRRVVILRRSDLLSRGVLFRCCRRVECCRKWRLLQADWIHLFTRKFQLYSLTLSSTRFMIWDTERLSNAMTVAPRELMF